MLALRENAGWPLDRIGKVFNHRKGHVSRCLRQLKQRLRDEFDMSPEVMSDILLSGSPPLEDSEKES